jgi:hypothetical protein
MGHLMHCVVSGTQNIDALFIIDARVGPVRIPQKRRRDTLHQTCVFASGTHYFSRSALSCVRDAPFFMLWWDRYGIKKKSTPRHVTQNLCFASGGREMSTHYCSCSGGTGMDSKNSTSRHVTPNLCFASGRIYGSRSAFHCVRDAKR